VGKLVHRERCRELEQRSGLSRVQIELGRSDEKPPPLLSEQEAQQLPAVSSRRLGLERFRFGFHDRILVDVVHD
jgi:hypothetical protein